MANFAEEQAVINIVQGEVEESVRKMAGVLLEKELVSLEGRRKIDAVITLALFFGITWHTSMGE